MVQFAVICLVGPSPDELRRLNNLMESLFFWEPQTPLVVLIDDSLVRRDLAALVPSPPTGSLVVLPNPATGRGHVWDRMSAGMMTGLAYLATRPEIEFVVKVDTDSLVIAPFSARVRAVLVANPNVGQVGRYNRDAKPEKWYSRGWLRPMGRLALPVRAWRKPGFPGFWLESALAGRAKEVRWYARAAHRARYRNHVLGGGNAISATAIQRMAGGGLLESPDFWVGHLIIEDHLISMYVKAVELELMDDSGNGGVFGVAGRGLPGTPQEMLQRDHAIIHAVKDVPGLPEDEIVEFFRRNRSDVA